MRITRKTDPGSLDSFGTDKIFNQDEFLDTI